MGGTNFGGGNFARRLTRSAFVVVVGSGGEVVAQSLCDDPTAKLAKLILAFARSFSARLRPLRFVSGASGKPAACINNQPQA
jgi:hypothetical protein